MVQEVRCFIPGCAPIEVCIVFSKEGSTSKTGKIFKPVIDCTENDVKDFINNFCNSTSPSDDLSNVNNNNRKYNLLGDKLELGKKSQILHKKLSPIINHSNINKLFIYSLNNINVINNCLQLIKN